MKFTYKGRRPVGLLSLLMIFFLSPLIMYSAPPGSTVTGIVRNEKDEALVHVSVTATNPQTHFSAGVQTDSNGVFRFSDLPAAGNYIFTVSYVGYEDQELSGYNLKEGGVVSIIVKLRRVNAVLDDVVVVGYGTARRRDLTGS
ncbi:MAG: carboxypeptidase regulatory-like domain-containing protein, partial [Chitinophagaceae bacterium]|nr:carboxypeptidase regulatory-like domain-containing protein [Chitinophagaceae bacterium]